MDKMNYIRIKLDFIDLMRAKHKIVFLSRKENIENVIHDSNGSLYLFFCTDESKSNQREIYDKHLKCLIQLAKDSTNDASQKKFVIVDMDLHPQASGQEMKIVYYENGELESANFLKDKPPTKTPQHIESKTESIGNLK